VKLRFSALFFIALFLQACGGTQVIPGESKSTGQYKTAYISEISITASEGNEDELAYNKEMEAYVRSKIEEIMKEKNFAAVDAAAASKTPTLLFKFKSTINYGNRSLRWVSGGFGSAGKGTVNSQFEATDSLSRNVVYSASAESDLKAGAFGGGMESTIQENIDELLDAFSAR
jgi:hypothetical protein